MISVQFSVCASSVFLNEPLHEALEKVAQAGIKHYEFWSWWDKDLDKVVAAQNRLGLKPAALCTKFVSLTDAACREEYLQGLRETMTACERLGCKTIISQVGNELENVPREEQHASLVQGLKKAAALLEGSGLTLVIEPLNTRVDHQGYYLWQSEEAFQIIDEVNSPCVRVLYDLYHQHIMDDLKLDRIIEKLSYIGHFHMAAYPGRCEPMEENEIAYREICEAIAKAGYDKHIGLEYFPRQEPLSSLIGQYAALKQYENL